MTAPTKSTKPTCHELRPLGRASPAASNAPSMNHARTPAGHRGRHVTVLVRSSRRRDSGFHGVASSGSRRVTGQAGGGLDGGRQRSAARRVARPPFARPAARDQAAPEPDAPRLANGTGVHRRLAPRSASAILDQPGPDRCRSAASRRCHLAAKARGGWLMRHVAPQASERRRVIAGHRRDRTPRFAWAHWRSRITELRQRVPSKVVGVRHLRSASVG
jgi:hypothetical protein